MSTSPVDLIRTPNDPALLELCQWLTEQGPTLDADAVWPHEQLARCGEAGVYRWFLPPAWGGFHWSYPEVIRGYIRLSAACMTTAFIITQRSAACRRIAASSNEKMQRELLPALADGRIFASVGISQLSTSRQHLAQPPLVAERVDHGYVLDGYTPWVTGGAFCDWLVIGGVLPSGKQVLLAVPRDTPGIECEPMTKLLALQASYTGRINFHRVAVPDAYVLVGPTEHAAQTGSSGGAGGLETSALALGLAAAAIQFLEQEAAHRSNLAAAMRYLRAEHQDLVKMILDLAAGEAVYTTDEVRGHANSLVLRATQAALTAAKGAGFQWGHPVARWCREAMFFLVWSCPHSVTQATLCELAGMGGREES